jgi:hypothetical protein
MLETQPRRLNQKSCGDDVSSGDTVDFSPLQLLEEAAHDLDGRNLVIISCRVSDRQLHVQKRCTRSMSTQTMTSQKTDRVSEHEIVSSAD